MNCRLKLVLAATAVFLAIVAAALAASSPAVSTDPAGAITASGAVLRGAVNPNGARTGYEFDWGLTSAYGSDSRARSLPAGTRSVPVSVTLKGLLPGTVYHFRLVALSRAGATFGGDRTFKTKGNPPPYAATGPTTQVSVDGGTVTAVINPNHQRTTWYFQYGLTAAYTAQTVVQTVPGLGSPVTVSDVLAGLQPGTMFHYRIVAVNRGVVEAGADATFMTYPFPAPVPVVHATTTPRHARLRPFVFTTSGRVIGPSSMPAQYACSGTVEIRFFFHAHLVSRAFVPLQPNCTFTGQAGFEHRPGRRHRGKHLTVLVQFLGNGYLARHLARFEQVSVG